MITVAGSINMDLVVTTDRTPNKGETLLGRDFQTNPGGKGANQAVAAARLGNTTNMIGHVGKDAFGVSLIENLTQQNVGTEYVKTKDGSSGIATITVAEGDNSIIVIPGANFSWELEEWKQYASIIQKSDVLILQLEIPLNVVEAFANMANKVGTTVILNPAPAQALPATLITLADYLTPNETECKELFGMEAEDAVAQFPNKLIVTEGEKGALYHDGTSLMRIPGFRVKAVDTTGAGDTFNGALASAIAEGLALKEAVSFANAAASLSVQHHGAQKGMPLREAVLERLGELE
ncbi:Ribokinase [Oceanobacillus picturae]|uniref:Ribokinase n=1 Tax=Oceanobacillus picturae TaxID=171693 RepID=W9AG84_9BACI|nr:ribokinase [Oceanobacillus picturae]CDO04724.1 Ribokinase [Oceanobacillus picturae]